MTMYPEVILAREAQICYISIAMVTDYDVWAEKPVSAAEVLETMEKNSDNFKKLIMGAIPEIPHSLFGYGYPRHPKRPLSEFHRRSNGPKYVVQPGSNPPLPDAILF